MLADDDAKKLYICEVDGAAYEAFQTYGDHPALDGTLDWECIPFDPAPTTVPFNEIEARDILIKNAEWRECSEEWDGWTTRRTPSGNNIRLMNFITLIKMLRERYGLDLLTAKTFVEQETPRLPLPDDGWV